MADLRGTEGPRDDEGNPMSKPPLARQIIVAVVLLATVAAIAGAGSLATIPNVDGWYADAEKVPWNPPDAVFGPTWSVLYVVLAIVGFLLWRSGYRGRGEPNEARKARTIYGVQLALNALWSPVFFAGYPLAGAVAWWVALAVIAVMIASVIWLIPTTMKHSRPAAWLLVPYLLWLLFASTLNAGIIALN